MLSARVERTALSIALSIATLREGLLWWWGDPTDLVALRLGLTAIGFVLIAITAEIVRRVRKDPESM